MKITDEMKDKLAGLVNEYRTTSYSTLIKWVEEKKIDTVELKDEQGQSYRVELQASWDDKRRKTIRFTGSIEAGETSWRNVFRSSITEDFIIAPDGSFEGE